MSSKKPRILFYQSGVCNENRVLENIRKKADEVFVISRKCKNLDLDPELASELFLTIHQHKIDLIFSLDYYPIIAEVAHTVGMVYASWVIDAPHYTLYSSTSYYDTTFIFHFDREECMRLKEMGRKHVYHQTLATDPLFFKTIINKSIGRYESDVAFLGASYQNEHDYFENSSGLSEYEMGFFEGIMRAQAQFNDISFVDMSIPKVLHERLLEVCGIRFPDTYDIPDRLISSGILEKKISVRDRKRIVETFAGIYGITLYSESDKLNTVPGVVYKGYADYETEMPVVFYRSRINLNPTLRCIHSGIALRALDILGAHGFLMSNYQPELSEWFEDGKSVAMYNNIDELLEKTRWYLEHEDERIKIADNGYEIVCRYFTYDKAIEAIIDRVSVGG